MTTIFTAAHHLSLSSDLYFLWCFFKIDLDILASTPRVVQVAPLNAVHMCNLLMSATSPAPVVCPD